MSHSLSLHTTVYWQLRRVDAHHSGNTVQRGCPFRAVDSFEPQGPHKPSTAYSMMHLCSTYNSKYLYCWGGGGRARTCTAR